MELNLQQNNMNKNKKEKMIDKKVIRFNLKKKMNLLENKFELLINQIKGINKRISTIEEEMEHNNNSKEVQEIIKLQPIMDEIIVANSDAIKIIKSEVKNIKQNKNDDEKTYKKLEKSTSNDLVKEIKCKYNNRGYCRNKQKCKYLHSNIVCEKHIKGEVCENNHCSLRHPRKCLLFRMKSGCRFGLSCQYIHENNDKEKSEQIKFQCIACQDILNDKSDIVEHIENEKTYYSCSRCVEYAKYMINILEGRITIGRSATAQELPQPGFELRQGTRQ